MTITTAHILEARQNIRDIVTKTPLELSAYLSAKYNAKIYLKREDLQNVKSYKIRGAYNLISRLCNPKEVVCASTGNHAQGVAYSCNKLRIKGTIFMPTITPSGKIEKVKYFGGEWITIKLVGRVFDDSYHLAKKYCDQQNLTFVHPFDDYKVIAGAGTIAVELMEDLPTFDFIFVPIGGGGLISGIGTYIKEKLPSSSVIGVVPSGCPSMYESITQKKIVEVDIIDTFVDGAAVRKPGKISFAITSKVINDICLIPEANVRSTMIQLYQEGEILAEPAGALSVAALDLFKDRIKDKVVVCIISGGNVDKSIILKQ